jgi:DNA-binding MarR family transcriptional regulator
MPKKPKPDYAAAPAVAAVLKLISRKRGATAAEVARARGCEPHTVRAIVSRLGSVAGVDVERTYEPERGVVYRVALRSVR